MTSMTSTIIAGSRTINSMQELVRAVLTCRWEITEIVSGCARGVDALGERWGAICGIPVRRFPADWDAHGRRAGFLRNCQMADYADALIAIWDGESRGTGHMIDIARREGLRVHIHLLPPILPPHLPVALPYPHAGNTDTP